MIAALSSHNSRQSSVRSAGVIVTFLVAAGVGNDVVGGAGAVDVDAGRSFNHEGGQAGQDCTGRGFNRLFVLMRAIGLHFVALFRMHLCPGIPRFGFPFQVLYAKQAPIPTNRVLIGTGWHWCQTTPLHVRYLLLFIAFPPSFSHHARTATAVMWH
jgi:hypothetical protein